MILGIDPGTRVTGWGIIADSFGKPSRIGSGAFRMGGKVELPKRLAVLYSATSKLALSQKFTMAAVEGQFVGHISSALQIGQARGVICAAIAAVGIPIRIYAPSTVKKAVAGNGRADKLAVCRAVQEILGIEHELGHDESDGLAMAICGWLKTEATE